MVESRMQGDAKIPEHLIAMAFENAEGEVPKDRLSLQQLGRSVPETPVDRQGMAALTCC